MHSSRFSRKDKREVIDIARSEHKRGKSWAKSLKIGWATLIKRKGPRNPEKKKKRSFVKHIVDKIKHRKPRVYHRLVPRRTNLFGLLAGGAVALYFGSQLYRMVKNPDSVINVNTTTGGTPPPQQDYGSQTTTPSPSPSSVKWSYNYSMQYGLPKPSVDLSLSTITGDTLLVNGAISNNPAYILVQISDGTTYEGSGLPYQHIFDKSGTYTITFTIFWNTLGSVSATATINVSIPQTNTTIGILASNNTIQSQQLNILSSYRQVIKLTTQFSGNWSPSPYQAPIQLINGDLIITATISAPQTATPNVIVYFATDPNFQNIIGSFPLNVILGPQGKAYGNPQPFVVISQQIGSAAANQINNGHGYVIAVDTNNKLISNVTTF